MKPLTEMDADEKKECRAKIKWLKTIGFTQLSDQPTPRIVHPDLTGETFDVFDVNPIALVKKIYDLGEDTVNKILKENTVIKNPKKK